MLHLVYRFRPTVKARADLAAFWQWIADRQLWFYADLDMVLGTRWYTVTIGDDVHCLEHHVTFADEAEWGRYRREISARSRDPEWEKRRTGQDEWYEILDARILTDPMIPVPLPAPEQPGPGSDAAALALRSRVLLDRARFVTLATSGPAGPWSSTVNYVVLHQPLRLLWYSLRDARHSMNIAGSPQVAGSIFLTGLTGSDAPSGIPIDGAQFTGECREVTADELPAYYDRYYESNFPDPAVRAEWMLPLDEFHTDGPRRFYRLDIDRWWLYDAQRWTEDKHDTRIEVSVAAIDR
ncbi:pyridoxamine 5'-phosphate oxidase family protein [Nocardia sp. NBC_01730]|uniref:pyridoxamine 5'-phosphate oxidase family protein n=1 Tax=Nocardia sp. NBC_01730 TaxID=2975998 RepID=UPI002E147366|nr:pyridoxamine 5'-phosphate oxidase family protein [Nocardia sp. NBC_01730]